MKQTTASRKAPSPTKKGAPAVTRAGSSKNPRNEFFVAALTMSWQLAVVVLVPIIGGFELDNVFGTLPALTIVGFVLAMGGMAAVVWRQLQLFSPPLPESPKEHHS